MKKLTILFSLCALIETGAAQAMTIESFEAFYSPLRTLYHYDEQGQRHANIFGFPNDGLNQAVRLVPMNNPAYPDEHFMYFYDRVGRDLFGESTPETIYIGTNELPQCPALHFSVSPSFTDLMHAEMSAQQAETFFTEHLKNALENASLQGDFDTVFAPIITASLTYMESQHGISMRFNEMLPHGLNPRLSCNIAPRP
jgi:hypothetical protein